MDDFILYGLAAAKQAVTDSGWDAQDRGRHAAAPAS